ncbi:ERF family protein [Tepidanaerobacter acetatoxydans Re1]|uniref:ERF family protein n=1 Tax=Tepidanaerobacter acetatoxydans (strain DSM 21804 / JCM 16047 / Re1) TaxID=1209989 RepID=F4LRV7_TEPAE|nr:ERF family protein [Tepidanaerobacter acetatoxydans]AEE91175.1 ERF family protein [Tepidanaerobacter acetatoxydans Re1]CCP25846.1 ERF family protein [Tepidanaerobacter acetatoxydans Re1]
MQKSESIKNIAKALAAFQAEVKNPANTEENPFFNSKYAPLNDILNTVRPILSKHGLSVLQSPSGDGQNVTVTTLITHESGEWIESDPLTLKADKATAQGAGSAITYARRYALSAMLGISSEDDDDGNFASGNNGNANPVKAYKKSPATKTDENKTQKPDKATAAQLKKLYAMANEKGIPGEEMKGLIKLHYSKDSSKDLTKQEASDLIEKINDLLPEQ